jgi:S1-C subfamily serine protease
MSDVLQSLSDAMAQTVEKAGASTVRVEARRRMGATGIVWSADGVIVTSNHGVERDEHIQVGLPNGETVAATLVGRDPSTDVAVLRAQISGLTVPAWGGIDTLRVGNIVLALGRPEKNVLATLGIVSALEGKENLPPGTGLDHYLQTDVVMYPGFSGGALVDASGRVVAMNTSALMRGVSAAVPVVTLQRVVDTLLQHGKMRRGYMGVGAQAVRLPDSIAQQVGQESGLLLMSVEADSPAAKGGLFLGDTLISLDGHKMRQPEELVALLTGDRVGKGVTLKVLRGGQVHDIVVTVGERA